MIDSDSCSSPRILSPYESISGVLRPIPILCPYYLGRRGLGVGGRGLPPIPVYLFLISSQGADVTIDIDINTLLIPIRGKRLTLNHYFRNIQHEAFSDRSSPGLLLLGSGKALQRL